MFQVIVCLMVLFCVWYFCFNDFFACVESLPRFFRHFDFVVRDLFSYFKNRKWEQFNGSGVVLYGGLFGTGKTLNMVHYACSLYRRYKNIEIVSNVNLKNIPFTRFSYFEQLSDPVPDGMTRIYLCDEFGSLFNSRNYKDNKITETEYIAVLNQIRKEHKLLLITTQRYGMLDKMFRQVAKEWNECHKFWRFYWFYTYDPYDLEYTNDPRLVKPLSVFPHMLFATKSVYSEYDTTERVKDFKNILEITNRADTTSVVNADYRYSKNARKRYYKR